MKMKSLIYLILMLSSGVVIADPSLTDQLNSLNNAQNQAIANERARAEAAYNAQIVEQKRQEQIAAQQREADRKLQEKLSQERQRKEEADRKFQEQLMQEKQRKEKEANDERLQDKYRLQAQEDEEREFIKQQSAIKIKQAELEAQRLKAQADLETAIANDRIKSVDADTALVRKRAATEIDVIQAGADVDRTVASGVASGLSGLGNEGLFKFLVVLFLIILVVAVVVIAWLYIKHQKSIQNSNSSSASKIDVDSTAHEQQNKLSVINK